MRAIEDLDNLAFTARLATVRTETALAIWIISTAELVRLYPLVSPTRT